MVYNLRLINDYINGLDTPGHNIEDLENSPEFMHMVIKVSNDKNFYNLCSDKVKKNYDFVSFLIDKFYYDIEYIDKVASFFIENNKDEYDNICIVVKMNKILEKSGFKDIFAKYRIKFMVMFFTDMVGIEKYKQIHPEDTDIGLGFMVLYDDYKYDEDVLKSYAKELINYIFDELGVDLEEDIHKEFRTPNDVNNAGLVNFMINYLNRYDKYLADYAAVHLDVLNGFMHRINDVQVKWNKYTDKEEAFRYEMMFSKVHEYMIIHELDGTISEDEYLYYIGHELGISAKIAKYERMDLETYEQIYHDVDMEMIDKTLTDERERFVYANLKRIMLETLFDKFEEEHNEGKIIYVDFKKPRK